MKKVRQNLRKLLGALQRKKVTIKNSRRVLAGKRNRYYRGKMTIRGTCEFGNYCAIGENLRILSRNHDYHLPATQLYFYEKYFNKTPEGIEETVRVGSDVWIGDNVIILKGVNVGDGACIGAGSVVTKDIEPYTIVAGVPAKFIKRRFSEEISSYLLKLKWWDWTDEKIKENRKFFMTDLSKLSSTSEVTKLIK